MTTYQLLRANESLLQIISGNKINITDVTHLGIYAEYQRMKEEGHKVSYITIHLADKYGMTDRGVYKVIRRLKKKVNVD
ncbi:hypothetical protein [uncultured Duncaniella sp.]|jgi:hypothetical protein|uniref:hypothetical protein n=1 Tax=uncultured Duncaniella sp. TaxID=2768039 RepID=UPI00265AF236|nr:hypothetical protein [uncultured Duncaniella sp.]